VFSGKNKTRFIVIEIIRIEVYNFEFSTMMLTVAIPTIFSLNFITGMVSGT
jgi:hypothetical protein